MPTWAGKSLWQEKKSSFKRQGNSTNFPTYFLAKKIFLGPYNILERISPGY